MKRLKQAIPFMILIIICAMFLLWYNDYSSDKVKVSYIDCEYTYQGDVEIADGKVDINKATAETLALIDGIGEKTAQAIVDYRTKYGAFEDIAEIKRIKGIGEKTYEQIKDYICIN